MSIVSTKESNAFYIYIYILYQSQIKISESQQWFVSCVDNHFGEYLWHFLAVRLYSWHNSKEPADCKLIHETVQQLHTELSQTRDAIRWHQAPKPKLFYWDITKAKLVCFTYIGHVSSLSSMGYRVLWNWFQVKWRQTSE